MSVANQPLPVAVIGAGPIGLVAAAHLRSRGETPVVLEAGATVGTSIRDWGHVRLFSPWKYLVEPLTRGLLESEGWQAPDGERLPTGHEFVTTFLEPLAAHPHISSHLRLGHRVVSVSRRGMDKVKTAGREKAPFEVVVRTPAGTTDRIMARAVIDASGTWGAPNPLGASGVPAAGEAEHADRIAYGIPDVGGRARDHYAGRRTAVFGSGHSAFNALLDLAALAESAPGTDIVWAVRRDAVGLMFGGGRDDALEARGELGARLQALLSAGRLRFVTGFRTERISGGAGPLVVTAEDGRRLEGLDRLVVATGSRPDLALVRELRTRLDPWLEAPERLAPLIDPNLHSCGTVYPHGAAELAHPEQDFYIVGMKSYGRAPTFLMLTGYEQVRSVACALTGDAEGARNVELVLPETGVCQTSFGGSDAGGSDAGGCCGAVGSSAGAGAEPAACCAA